MSFGKTVYQIGGLPLKKQNKTTIKDVANQVGISVTAVSLILNGKGKFTK